MSLIMVVYVEEGIVLASDSRTTYNQTIPQMDGNGNMSNNQFLGVHFTENTNKTFLCPNDIGISTCGDASVCGKPITGYIEKFIRDNISEETDVDDVPKMLIGYFETFTPKPSAFFFVAGYHKENEICEQRVWGVNTFDSSTRKIQTTFQGAEWNGDFDVLSRLFTPVFVENNSGYIPMTQHAELAKTALINLKNFNSASKNVIYFKI